MFAFLLINWFLPQEITFPGQKAVSLQRRGVFLSRPPLTQEVKVTREVTPEVKVEGQVSQVIASVGKVI